MIRKISVEELKPGMYIENFDCGWMRHPFLNSSVKVKDQKTIDKIIGHGIHKVYIDSEKGPDVYNAPTHEEIKTEIQNEINLFVETTPEYEDTATVKEETGRAKEIKKEARIAVRSLMEDIRVGKQVEIEKIDPLAEKLVQSVLRNQTALTSLSRIKKVDEYTFEHSVSVGALLIAFGRQLGFDYAQIKLMGIGGLLHDIGKVKVAPGILMKKGALTDNELSEVKQHVVKGRKILEESTGLDNASVHAVIHHHERMDGTGYPESLRGDMISEYGQMAAIVDVYDAITSNRCYQRKMPPTEALKKLYEWSEYHYNRDLVQQFIRCIGIYPVGTLVQLKNDLLAVVLSHNAKNILHPSVRLIFDTKKERYLRVAHDIDLAESGDEEQILSYAQPEKYNIRPELFM